MSSLKKRGAVCFAVLLVNLILFFLKLYAAISSNSISIYVDSLNSLADSGVCVLALIGFKISSARPNAEFPYGYGKIEELVSFVLSCVILITGAAFAYTSLQRFVYPVPVWYSLKYALVIGGAAATKLITAVFLYLANKKDGSKIIKGLGVDSILDFFISACIVVSFTLTASLGYAVDSVTGLIASAVIMISGAKSLSVSCKALIGKRNDELCGKAQGIMADRESVLDIRDVQCHAYGERLVFTAEIACPALSARELAALSREIENDIKAQLNAQIYILWRTDV